MSAVEAGHWVAIVALGLGWLLAELRLRAERREAVKDIEAARAAGFDEWEQGYRLGLSTGRRIAEINKEQTNG
ncbi:MAG: hypothetical protein ABIP03_06055 [Aquihabitans sp.]